MTHILEEPIAKTSIAMVVSYCQYDGGYQNISNFQQFDTQSRAQPK